MSRKSILFVMNTMNIGGIQRSLIELLKAVSGRYDTTLYCVDAVGPLLEEIPENTKLIRGSAYAGIPEMSFQEIRKRSAALAPLRLLFAFLARNGMKKLAVRLYLLFFRKIPGSYDIAVSFSQPIDDRSFCKLSNEIVLSGCRAKKKITFLHCDFEKYEGNTAYNRSLYQRFDKIVPVSDSVGQVFMRCTGISPDRVRTVYNICDAASVRERSAQDALQYNGFSFVVIARLGREKGLERVISCAERLNREGFTFEVHLVGGGPLETQLRETIRQKELEGIVFMHGEQNNPYRFMRNAGCLLVPSYHEAFPMIFLEAIALSLPVLTTDTLSAKEIIRQYECGAVCENTEEGILAGMRDALANGIRISRDPEKELLLSRGKRQFDELVEELTEDVH